MKTLLTFTISSLLFCYSFSQETHSSCDGSRYIDDLFTSVDTAKSIFYGKNTTINGVEKDLYLDVYQPKGDLEAERPTIVFAFGGSFIGGERSDVDWICTRYAKKGFVAVAIDYRLYDKPIFSIPTSEDMTDVAVKATFDMKAAIRFLKNDASLNNTFGIDTNHLFSAGISSGAIMASHVAYLDSADTFSSEFSQTIANNGGIEGNTNTLMNSSDVKGVVSFSGALLDSNFIDEGDVPIFSVHEDGDEVVPFGNGFATLLGIPIVALNGSSSTTQRANFVNVTNELITIPNSDEHVGYFFGDNRDNYRENVILASANFLENITCPSPVGVENITETNFEIYPNPSFGQINFSIHEPQVYSIKIYSAKGKLIRTMNSESTNTILSSGIYFIEINGNNISSRQKVIIN